MHQFILGMAMLLTLAIIVIGALYLTRPRAIARGFGLPLPEEGPNVEWWLRLKGVRDIASGLIVLVVMTCVGSQAAGLVLLVAAVIPVGDMLIVLAGKGSVASAVGIHGATALVMILAAVPLIAGAA